MLYVIYVLKRFRYMFYEETCPTATDVSWTVISILSLFMSCWSQLNKVVRGQGFMLLLLLFSFVLRYSSGAAALCCRKTRSWCVSQKLYNWKWRAVVSSTEWPDWKSLVACWDRRERGTCSVWSLTWGPVPMMAEGVWQTVSHVIYTTPIFPGLWTASCILLCGAARLTLGQRQFED